MSATKNASNAEISFRFLEHHVHAFSVAGSGRFFGAHNAVVVKQLISPFGALLWILVVGFGLKIVVENFSGLRVQGEGILATNNLFLLYISTVVIKALHEFGHAYFCRRFGGEVHVMGVMLMIFTPMPFVDATSSWSFRERWKRVLVGAAGHDRGIIFRRHRRVRLGEDRPGHRPHLAYNIMFVASVSTVIFNVNPLMRFDGYYIYPTCWEIPNLSQRASLQMASPV